MFVILLEMPHLVIMVLCGTGWKDGSILWFGAHQERLMRVPDNVTCRLAWIQVTEREGTGDGNRRVFYHGVHCGSFHCD